MERSAGQRASGVNRSTGDNLSYVPDESQDIKTQPQFNHYFFLFHHLRLLIDASMTFKNGWRLVQDGLYVPTSRPALPLDAVPEDL